MQEVWKDIKGYEGIYRISNLGNVLSLERLVEKTSKGGNLCYHRQKERILKQITFKPTGKLFVNLQKEGKLKPHFIHILVATYFVKGLKSDNNVIHKDGNVKNNRYDNLIWLNNSETMQRQYDLNKR